MTGLGAVMFVSFSGDGKLYVNRYLDTSESGWDVARFATGTWSPLESFATLDTHQCVSVKASADGYVYMTRVQGAYYKSNTAGAAPVGQAGGLGGDARGTTIGPDGVLYMCSIGGQKIARVATQSLAILSDIPVTGYANGVNMGPDASGDGVSDLYVTYWAQPVVDIYNSVTGAKIKVFDSLANYGYSGSICTQVVFSKDGNTAYFTDWNDGKIFKKVGSAAATEFIAGLTHPSGLDLSDAYSPADTTDYLAVLNDGSSGSVAICNSATGAVVNTTSMANLGAVMDASFGEYGYLYVNRYLEATASGWDIARFSVGLWAPLEQFATLGTHRCVSVKYWADGNVYMGGVNGVIYRTNTPGDVTDGFWGGLGGDSRGMTIGPDGTIYVCSQGGQWISRAYMPTMTRLPNIPVTGYPNGLALGPDATGDGVSDLYVAYWGQPVVDIYNSVTGAKFGVFDSLANYGYPGSLCVNIAFSADGNTAYLTDFTDGIVFKKVGGAPATPFITGLYHPRAVALRNGYAGTRFTNGITDTKKLTNETQVVIADKIVTAVVDTDYFYMEDTDRTSGILVYKHVGSLNYDGVQVGDKVEVSGVVRDLSPDGVTYSGERFINAQSGNVYKTLGTPLEPLFVTNKALGGGDLGVAPYYQQGVVNGSGINNIGLLIKTTGLVSQVDTSTSSFNISDGSGVSVTAVLAVGAPVPSNGDYIKVTGISSCFKNMNDQLERVIKVTEWQKVTP